jgi:hypothetical protein
VQLAHLVVMEVKHRCNQVLELGFPLGGLAKLFAQEWEGDVTIVMPATVSQVCALFKYQLHIYFIFLINKKNQLHINIKKFKIANIKLLNTKLC